MKCLIINHNTKYVHELKKLFSDFITDIVNYEEFDESLVNPYDFIVLSGGPINISSENDIIKEKKFIKKTNKPIFGICLGLQILGVVFGSKLYKLESKKEGLFDFEVFNQKREIYYDHEYFIKDVPDQFILLKKERETVEAMQHKTKPFFAIQGHPEMSGEHGKEIRNLFLDRFVKK